LEISPFSEQIKSATRHRKLSVTVVTIFGI
jgi:hypothetical protein